MPSRPRDVPADAIDGASPDVAELAEQIRRRLRSAGVAHVLVPDPDEATEPFPGEPGPDGVPHRSLRDWLDLAEAVGARMRTPRPVPASDPPRLLVGFERATGASDLHADGGRPPDRYGVQRDFSRLHKMALPGFLLPLLDALAFAAPRGAERVLVLGCHRGDELAALAQATPPIPPEAVVGIDRQADALDEARRRHPGARFLRADANDLPADLGRFDLILVIDVLQSPELDGPATLARLVRDHASGGGGLVVGLPCSRLVDRQIVWGARTRNYAEVDLSLVVRDLAGHRRYLHQHGYRTRIGGRYDLLLAGRREGSPERERS